MGFPLISPDFPIFSPGFPGEKTHDLVLELAVPAALCAKFTWLWDAQMHGGFHVFYLENIGINILIPILNINYDK